MRRLPLLLGLLVACQKDFSIPEIDPAIEPGQIKVLVNQDLRSTADYSARVRALRLTSSAEGSPTVTAAAGAADKEVILSDVPRGTRSVTVEGLDSAGVVIYRGDAEAVEVQPGKTATAAVILNGLAIVGLVVVNGSTGEIEVSYTLADPEGDPCLIGVEYLGGKHGLFFGPATLAAPAVNVQSGPRKLSWSSHQDEATDSVYALRLTPFDDNLGAAIRTGIAGTSPFFAADNTTPHDGSVALAGGAGYVRNPEVELALSARAASFVQLWETTDLVVERPMAARVPFTLSASDGVKRVNARFRGANNLLSGSVSTQVILDTRPPGCHDSASDTVGCSAVRLAGGVSRTRNTRPTLELESKDADFVTLSLDDPSFAQRVPRNFAATLPLDLGPSPDDRDYTVYALFADQAGNTDLAQLTFTLDHTPPSAPALAYPESDRQLMRDAVPFRWVPPSQAESEPLSYRLRVIADRFCTTFSVVVREESTSSTETVVRNLDDGEWYWCVTSLDAAGNESSDPEVPRFVLDNSPPELETVASPTNERQPTLEWSIAKGFTGSRFKAWLTGPSAQEADGLTDLFWTTGPLGDGNYEWNVARYQDDSNDLGDYATRAGAFRVDTVPPSAPLLVDPDGETLLALDSVTFEWTASSDLASGPVSYHVWVKPIGPGSRGLVVDEDVASATEILRVLPDGRFTWWVRAVDKAQNAAESETETFVVDTRPPAQPLLQSFSGGVVATATPEFTVVNFEPSYISVRYVRQSDGYAETVSAGFSDVGEVRLDPESPLAEESYRAVAVAEDLAGNVIESFPISFQVDTLPPSQPVLLTPVHESLSSKGTVRFSWAPSSDAAGGSITYHLRVTQGFSGTVIDDLDTATELVRPVPDGELRWTVAAIDTAGNSSVSGELTFFVDTQRPPTPTIVLAGGGSFAPARPTFTVIAEEGATVTVRYGPASGETTDTVVVQWAGELTQVDASTSLTDGTFRAVATVSDLAGNASSSQALTFYVDSVQPTAPTILAPSSPYVTSSTVSFSWSESSDPNGRTVSYAFRVDQTGGGFGLPFSHEETLAKTSTFLAVPDGEYEWEIAAVDEAGNRSPGPVTGAFTVDTVAPQAPRLLPPTLVNFAARAPFTVESFEPVSMGDTVSVTYSREGSGSTEESSTDREPQRTPVEPTADFAEGIYSATATARDAAGNATKSEEIDFQVDLFAPDPPVLLDPDFDLATSSTVLTFDWAESFDSGPGTLRYRVLVAAPTSSGDCPQQIFPSQSSGGTTTESEDSLFLDNGSWCWTVVAIDEASHQSTQPAPRRLTIDTRPPAPPTLVSFPDNLVTNALPAFQVNSQDQQLGREQVSIVYWREDGGATDESSTDRTGFSTMVRPAAPLAEAVYQAYALITDAAGNSGQSGQISFTVDLSPPTAPVPTSPASQYFTNDPSVRFAWEASSDTGPGVVRYFLSIRSVESGGACGVFSPPDATATLIEGTDSLQQLFGEYCWVVYAVDGSGRSGPPSPPRRLGVDTNPPSAPSLSVASVVTLPRPQFQVQQDGSAGAGGTIAVAYWRDDGSATETVSTTLQQAGAGSSVVSLIPGDELAEGAYQAYASAIDRAGNSTPSSTVQFNLDLYSPGEPPVSEPANGLVSSSASVRFAWGAVSDSGPGAVRYHLVIQSGQIGACNPELTTSHPDFALTDQTDSVERLNEGLSCWAVFAVDGSGQASPATRRQVTVDTVPPLAPTLLAPSEGEVITGPQPQFQVQQLDTWAPGDTVSVTFWRDEGGDAETIVTVRPNIGMALLGPTDNLAEGSYNAYATATDAAGSSTSSTTVRFKLDLALPATPQLVEPVNEHVTNSASVRFVWGAVTDSGPGTVRYHLVTQTSGSAGGCTAPATDHPEFALTDQTDTVERLVEGTTCWTVFAVDGSGRASQPAVQRTVTVDTSIPPMPQLRRLTNDLAFVPRPFFQLDQLGSEATTVVLHVVDSAFTELFTWSYQHAGTGSLTAQASDSLSDGTVYQVYATNGDAAGNVSSVSSTISFTVDLTADPPTQVRLTIDPVGGGAQGPTMLFSPESSSTVAYVNDPTPVLEISAQTGQGFGTFVIVVENADDGTTASAFDTPSALLQVPPLDNGRYRFSARVRRTEGPDSGPTYAEETVQDGATTRVFHLFAGPITRSFAAPFVPPSEVLTATGCPEGSRLVRFGWQFQDASSVPAFAAPLRGVLFQVYQEDGSSSFILPSPPNQAQLDALTEHGDCQANGTVNYTLSVVDAAGNMSPPLNFTSSVDTVRPEQPTPVYPADNVALKDPFQLQWGQPPGGVSGYLVTLETESSSDRWSCAGAFCSPQPGCAGNEGVCRSTWRCSSAIPEGATDMCAAYDSLGTRDALTDRYCTYPARQADCAGTRYQIQLGWRCRRPLPSEQEVRCSYKRAEQGIFSSNLDLPYVIPDSRYQWSINAHDEYGNLSFEGPRADFKIDRRPPSDPEPQSPAENFRTKVLLPSFQWSNPQSTMEFNPSQVLEICVDQGGSFLPFSQQSVTPYFPDMNYTSTQILPEGLLTWRVTVTDEAGNVGESAAGCGTGRPFEIDRTPPTVPTPLSPSGGETTLSPLPTFTWTREDGATEFTEYGYKIYRLSNGALERTCGPVPQPPQSEGVVSSTLAPAICQGAGALDNNTGFFWRVFARDNLNLNESNDSALSTAALFKTPL